MPFGLSSASGIQPPYFLPSRSARSVTSAVAGASVRTRKSRYLSVAGAVKLARATTVLPVDDDGAWRAVLERVLRSEGMRGIGLDRGDQIAVVRYRWPDLPVIVMTAFGGSETGELARRRGATGYLEKPFRMSELVTEVERTTRE